MSTIADLLIKVRADTDGATKDLDRVGKKGSSSLGKVGKMAGKAALGLGATAGVGLAWAAKIGFDEFNDGQKIAAQTNAVLKSTGSAAGVSAGHISNLAGSLLKKSGVDDEAIQSGENLLLTFTNIRNEAGKGNDIFDQTTKTMLDMSVALGQDTKSSAIQLGKALNDPIKGVTALQRVGVSFTAQQKAQIKTLVESGNTLGAQKLILAELTKEFGGSAEAAGKTFSGQLNIAKETATNFAGEMVGKMIPILQSAISWLRDHWPEINSAIQRFWSDVKPIFAGLISIAVAVVDTIRNHWSTIGPIVKAVAAVIEQVAHNIATALKLVTALLHGDWSEAWKQAKALVVGILNGIKLAIEAEMKVLVAVMRGLGTAMKNAVVGALEGIGGAAWNVINNIGSVVGNKLGTVAGWGAEVGGHLVSGIVNGLSGLGGRIVGLIKTAVNGVIDRINSVLSFHVSVNTHIPGVGTKSFGYDSHIPHLARGARNFAGGTALVGERGPELVNLPGGADVYTNAQTRGMMNDGGDVVLMLDRDVLARFNRRELSRKGTRNVGLQFGTAS